MNLLPDIEKSSIKKGLRLRFLVVFSFVILLATIIGITALIPAYVLARVRLLEIVSQSKNTSDIIRDEQSTKLLALPEEIRIKLAVFEQLVPQHTASEVLYTIANAVTPGVSVKSLVFTGGALSDREKKKELSISGSAATRQSLIDFAEALKSLDVVSSVDVPVSSLTKERDLPFSVKIIMK